MARGFGKSAADAARNIGKSFNMGFNPRAAFGSGVKGLPLHGIGNGFSMGGVMTAGGLAMGGAAIGGAVGTQLEGDAIGPSAAVGAAVGFAALPAAGLAASTGVGVGSAIIKNAGNIAEGVGKMAMGVGSAGLKAGSSMLSSPTSIAGNAIPAAVGFGSMMVDWDRIKKAETLMGSVKLTNPFSGAKAGWNAGKGVGKVAHGALGAAVNGQTVLWGGALLAGAAGAVNKMNTIHMGQMDGMVTTPTAKTPYLDNAGATGDLVFAMNANRRG